MKAIINKQYGSPNLLELREVERPEPKADEVLIKVLAVSVNRADWYILNGKPFPVRLMAGLFKPKYNILGADVAGVVVRTGMSVTQFRPGDEVFGDLSGSGFGGFAEYVTTDEKRLTKKPSNFSFEEAATLPMASLTALQGLRDKGRIAAGQEVLINGASGGVGSFAMQIAKYFGAEVTAVCSTKKAPIARKLGADHIIDYTREDFTKAGNQYDLIFDIVGNHSVASLRRALKPRGRYVTCAFSMAVILLGPLMSIMGGKRMMGMLSEVNPADLQFMCKLAEEGFVKPLIEKTYTLDDVPEALQVMGRGSAAGKLVVTI